MAYSEQQKRYFARELSRAGNVAAAARRLREEYESMRSVSESTLRRFLKEKRAADLIAEESAVLLRAERKAVLAQEQDRVRRELEGSHLERLARDEAILDSLRGRVLDELKNKDFDAKSAARLYERMTRIHDKRRETLLPAVAETKQATWLVESVSASAVARFGEARAKEFLADVRERYEARVAEASGRAGASGASGASGAR